MKIFITLSLLLCSLQALAKDPAQPVKLTTVTSMQGQSIELGKMLGKKPIYFKFWASWCVPCNKQMPHFEQTFQQYGQDIAMYSVNIDINDDIAAVNAMIKKYGLSMPTIRDVSGQLSHTFDLIGTPLHVLIDTRGKLVHRGHDVNDALATKLHLLAANNTTDLPTLALNRDASDSVNINQQGEVGVFFSSVWCDWYLADSRPSQSQNCIAGQQHLNQWLKSQKSSKQQNIKISGVMSRLWTDKDELKAYQDKYQVNYPLDIDQSNASFIRYGIKKIPTLLIFKDGVPVQRITDFSSAATVKQQLDALL